MVFTQQAYYLAVPFPIEKALASKITTFKGGVVISELSNYPVRGFVFEGGNTLEDLSNAVSDSCICLQENNIPFNVFISDSAKRIFLLPQVRAFRPVLLIVILLGYNLVLTFEPLFVFLQFGLPDLKFICSFE